jgi:hypothetical protein
VICLLAWRPDKPPTPINTFQLIIFAYPEISATINRRPDWNAKAPGLLNGLALAVALLKEADVVLDVFIGGIFAQCDRQRGMRAFVVAAQHV